MLKYAVASVVLIGGFAVLAQPASAAPRNDNCVNCAPTKPYDSEDPARIRQEMDRDRAPDNVTIDAYASYKTGPYRFAVNLYNLANRLNYTQVFGNRAVPAAGRTVIFSVGATF